MVRLLLALFALACTPKAPEDSDRLDADGDRWFADEDCDDADPTVNPGQVEIPYDGLDNDCDPGTADDDLDGDGAPGATDCDDQDPTRSPDADELCDGVDNDCDGRVDTDAIDALSAWLDADRDGYGEAGVTTTLCAITTGWSANDDDCDDADSNTYPGAPEYCDGIDQDCDGTADEGLMVPYGFEDGDGDGYGDPARPLSHCDAVGVSNGDDCDDTDPAVYPGAVELQDGVDNDCNTLTDEPIVAIIVGYQCQVYAASYWADELQAARDYLTDLQLGWEEFNEDLNSSTDDVYVGSFRLAMFCKCGWAWQSYNQDMVDALVLARSRGTHTFFFDDDIAWLQSNVTGTEALTRLVDAPSNGTQPSSAVVDWTVNHPILTQQRYGAPADFTYNWDMDRTSVWGVGETVLGTHSGGYPWWIVWEDTNTGVRSATVVASVARANEGPVGAGAEASLEIVFKETVAWILDLP